MTEPNERETKARKLIEAAGIEPESLLGAIFMSVPTHPQKTAVRSYAASPIKRQRPRPPSCARICLSRRARRRSSDQEARHMIEHNPPDEEILWEIDDRIGRGRMQPATPAEIEEAARRIAAVIAEYPVRYRNVVETVKSCATTFYATLTGIMPGDRGLVMSHEEAIAAAERDEVFDERSLAKSGTLGHRVLSMLS